MKGISPIVASVLLIAVTMTIAGVLAYWSSSFVEKQLPATTDADCKFANFIFDSCTYNSTTQKISFILNNRRNVDLKNLTAYISYPNNTVSSAISLNISLLGNELKSSSISGVPSDFSTILIKTHCSEATTSSTCTRA